MHSSHVFNSINCMWWFYMIEVESEMQAIFTFLQGLHFAGLAPLATYLSMFIKYHTVNFVFHTGQVKSKPDAI